MHTSTDVCEGLKCSRILLVLFLIVYFLQVSQVDGDDIGEDLEALAEAAVNGNGGGGLEDDPGGDGGEEEEDEVPPEEYVHVDERFYYLEYIIRYVHERKRERDF